MYLLHHPYHSMDPWFQHSYFKLMGDTQGETSSHQNNPVELFKVMGRLIAEKRKEKRWPKQLFYFPFLVHDKSTSS